MYGSDQRDGHTIPSEFARIASDDGHPVQVVNFGVPAYTTYQETQQLKAAIDGGGKPDLVIFYDGFNDIAVTLGYSFIGRLGDLPPRAPSLVTGPAKGSDAARASWPQRAPAWLTPQQRYELVIDFQVKAAAVAQEAVADIDAEVLHYWQPNAFTRTPTPEELAQLRYLGYDDLARQTYARIYEEIRERLPSGYIDLTDALDAAPTVYTDQVHHSELGARIIAKAMYEAATPTLRTLE